MEPVTIRLVGKRLLEITGDLIATTVTQRASRRHYRRYLFLFRDDCGSFLSPPTIFVRAPCSPEHLARLLSPFVLFSSSPSITRIQPPPSSVWYPPSSVRWRATNPPAPADQCPLLVSRPSVPYAVFAR